MWKSLGIVEAVAGGVVIAAYSLPAFHDELDEEGEDALVSASADLWQTVRRMDWNGVPFESPTHPRAIQFTWHPRFIGELPN